MTLDYKNDYSNIVSQAVNKKYRKRMFVNKFVTIGTVIVSSQQ